MPDAPNELVDQLASTRYGGVTVVDPANLTDDERRTLPSWWIEAAAIDGPDGVLRAANRWRAVVPGLFSATVGVFEDRAAGLYIGRETGVPSTPLILVYVLDADPDAHDRFVCWYGYPPADHLDNRTTGFRPGVRADLTQLPKDLRSFYTQLDNRFRVAGLGEAGLYAVDDLFTLDGDPEDYEIDRGGHVKPNPETLLPVLGSSWGNLCLEIGTEEAWQQDDELLQPPGDFLPALDTWLQRFCSPIQ